MYFKMHMIVTVLLALTYPRAGQAALVPGSASIVQGQPDGSDRLTVMLSFTAMFVFSAANAFVFVPGATSTMWKLHRGTLTTGPSLRCVKVYIENYADGEDQFARRKPVGRLDLSREEIRSTLVC